MVLEQNSRKHQCRRDTYVHWSVVDRIASCAYFQLAIRQTIIWVIDIYMFFSLKDRGMTYFILFVGMYNNICSNLRMKLDAGSVCLA